MLEVIEPGLLTTVQDFGRIESVALGVPVGGTCDRWSLAVANVLVGNAVDAAALELTLAGATFLARDDCLVAVAGADMGVSRGSAFRLRKGERLEFGATLPGTGVRTYLAVAGGVDVPVVLGSRSTCLVGGFGGFEGRALRAGDVIRSASSSATVGERRWPGQPCPRTWETQITLRVLPGPNLSLLPPDTMARLTGEVFRHTGRGDRQGIRLDGPKLDGGVGEMLSQGVTWGGVQLPPDGAPIVLLADHQTVGGYPVAAVVISADLPLLGQLGPGDELRFIEVDPATAIAALVEQDAAFRAAMTSLNS